MLGHSYWHARPKTLPSPNQTKNREPRIYFLKKIHKNPMGIRPIVSSIGSTTETLSQFVDKRLQPLIKGLPSYVKDTTDFINLIKELFPERI